MFEDEIRNRIESGVDKMYMQDEDSPEFILRTEPKKLAPRKKEKASTKNTQKWFVSNPRLADETPLVSKNNRNLIKLKIHTNQSPNNSP